MRERARWASTALLTPGRIASVGFAALSALVIASALVLAVRAPGRTSPTEPLRSGLLAAASGAGAMTVTPLTPRVLSDRSSDRLGVVEPSQPAVLTATPVGTAREGTDTGRPTRNDPSTPPPDGHSEPDRVQPDLDASMLVSNVDATGTPTPGATRMHARPGDRLIYTITVVNRGEIPTSGSAIQSHFPSGTTWIANECSVNHAGDTESVCLRTGPGGDASHSFVAITGGLGPGERVTVSFTVLVNPDAPEGMLINNDAHAYPTPAAVGRPFDSNLTTVGVRLSSAPTGLGTFSSFLSWRNRSDR